MEENKPPHQYYIFDSQYNGTALDIGDVVEFIRFVPRSTKCYLGCPDKQRKTTNYRGWWDVRRLSDGLEQRLMRKHLKPYQPTLPTQKV